MSQKSPAKGRVYFLWAYQKILCFFWCGVFPHRDRFSTLPLPMKWSTTLFFFLLGWVHSFRFKRPPKLSSQSWTDALNFVGYPSIRRATRCYAYDGIRRSWEPSRNGTGSASNGGGIAEEKSAIKDGDALFLFDRNYNNPTQRDVDAYFRSKPDPTPEQVVDILQRTVTFKKKKNIDVLYGDRLLIVLSSLHRVLSDLKLSKLRHATVGIMGSLQVIPLDDIDKSGT